jgi:hypothetical protein
MIMNNMPGIELFPAVFSFCGFQCLCFHLFCFTLDDTCMYSEPEYLWDDMLFHLLLPMVTFVVGSRRR